MRPVLWVILVAACALVISGCAGGTAGIVKDGYKASIAPGKLYETCFDMLSGQTLDYSFEATRPVNFNIHYHERDSILYPVSHNRISAWQGTFVADRSQTYCMMWENPQPDSADLVFKYTIRPK